MESLRKQLMKIDIKKLKDCILKSGYIVEVPRVPEKNKKIITPRPEIQNDKKPSIPSISTIPSIPSTIPILPSNMSGVYYKPVNMSDKRFDEINDRILESYPNSCVLYINEVMNETLENAFIKRFSGTTNAKILQLFHGTTNNVIDIIAKNGFDPTLTTVAAYGYGTYFAKNANYSKDYMRSSEDVTYMFLADVIVGRLATKRLRIPGIDPVYDWDNNVDSFLNPTIYTTPYPDGAYPRYIIAFHKNAR